MPDTKLSALPAGAAVSASDLFYSVQSLTSVSVTAAQIATFAASGGMAIGGAVSGGTDKSVLFINPSGVLAQDNPHFTFDPVTNFLNVGDSSDVGAYYLDTKPALFRVPNVSGDNWFEGSAGNFTTTGFQNFGTGDGALVALTSGSQNLAIGAVALAACTTGVRNVGLGRAALYSVTSGEDNVALGESAGWNLTSGKENVAIGRTALGSNTVDLGNVAMGFSALGTLGSLGGAAGVNNIGIGNQAGSSVALSAGSIFMGAGAGGNASQSSLDTLVGISAGASLTGTITRNVFVGNGAGYYYTGGSSNTILGSWNGNPSGGTINNAIILAQGLTHTMDWNYLKANIWSMQNTTTAVGHHIYNTLDSEFTPTNYERGCIDWNLTANTFRIASQAGGTGTVRIIAIDGFSKAGAPANTDLPSGTWALIDDTSGNQTWLVFNKGGTIRKVQLT